MITLSTSGNSIIFTFQDNQHYLQNGTIEVPKNSLLLVTDDSNMATFKKSASNDIFISALYSELGMTKAELETWFEENATTNYGGGVTSGEVQTLIDESISGKADTSAVTAVNDVLTAHTANTTVHVTSSEKSTWNAKSDFSGSYNDLTDKPTIPVVPTSNTAFTNDAGYITEDAISGKADTSAVTAVNNVLTAHTANTTIHVTAGDKLTWDGKQDALTAGTGIDITNDVISCTVTGGGNNVVELTQAQYDSMVSGGTVDPTVFYIITDATPIDLSGYAQTSAVTAEITAAVSGKQDTLVSGTNIKTINNQSLLGSGNIDIQGGGKAISAGTNISVTTGETADTINCTLPIMVGGNFNNCLDLTYGSGNENSGARNVTLGAYTKTTNNGELAIGRYNVSNTTSTAPIYNNPNKTVFSVGNGTSTNARHNAFEIRQNGDIYISKDGQDVKLQDQLGGGAASSAITSGDTNAVAGGAVYDKFDEVEQVTAAALNALNDNFGGLKLVRLTQQEYDNLSVKDSQTLYIIADVPFAGKWLATYTGGTTDSASCDSTSAITGNEITLTDLENLVIGDCVESIDFWAFDGATSLTSVTISDSVTSIGNCAFQNCNGLTDVTIGSGVTSIGGGAFNSTNGLFTLTIHATTPPTLTNDIFSEANGGIFVPAEAVQDYQNANIWSNYAQGIQPIQ